MPAVSVGPARTRIASPTEIGVLVGHLHEISKVVQAEKKFWTAIRREDAQTTQIRNGALFVSDR